jgi:hypothetical protein
VTETKTFTFVQTQSIIEITPEIFLRKSIEASAILDIIGVDTMNVNTSVEILLGKISTYEKNLSLKMIDIIDRNNALKLLIEGMTECRGFIAVSINTDESTCEKQHCYPISHHTDEEGYYLGGFFAMVFKVLNCEFETFWTHHYCNNDVNVFVVKESSVALTRYGVPFIELKKRLGQMDDDIIRFLNIVLSCLRFALKNCVRN